MRKVMGEPLSSVLQAQAVILVKAIVGIIEYYRQNTINRNSINLSLFFSYSLS